MRNLQFSTSLVNKLGVNQLQDVTDQLPHNPAYTWAELTGRRDLNDLTTIVLHHSGVPKSAGCTAATHAKNHINGRAYEEKGEPGIPYHFYIRGGQAYQVNDVLDRVYGVGDHNAYTVHICVEGEYAHTDALTDADRAALYATIVTVKQALPAFKEIKAHCELNKTECPGYDYNRVRRDVQDIEMQLVRDSSQESRRGRAYDVMNEVSYMYGLIGPGDGKEEWSLNWFDEFYDFLKSKNMV